MVVYCTVVPSLHDLCNLSLWMMGIKHLSGYLIFDISSNGIVYPVVLVSIVQKIPSFRAAIRWQFRHGCWNWCLSTAAASPLYSSRSASIAHTASLRGKTSPQNTTIYVKRFATKIVKTITDKETRDEWSGVRGRHMPAKAGKALQTKNFSSFIQRVWSL